MLKKAAFEKIIFDLMQFYSLTRSTISRLNNTPLIFLTLLSISWRFLAFLCKRFHLQSQSQNHKSIKAHCNSCSISKKVDKNKNCKCDFFPPVNRSSNRTVAVVPKHGNVVLLWLIRSDLLGESVGLRTNNHRFAFVFVHCKSTKTEKMSKLQRANSEMNM